MLRHGLFSRWLALTLGFCLGIAGLPGGVPIASAWALEPADETVSLEAAILPLEVSGELSEADRASLTSELVDGLQRGNFAVIAPEQVSQASPDAAGCDDADCMKAIAAATGSTHVVQARVAVEDRDYQVSVELFDGKSGQSLARSQEGCEICGIADAGELMATAAATLRTKLDALASGPSTLEVTSEPAEAEVRIDGELVGVTPLQRSVVPGKRVLRISKEGYITLEREVTFVEGVQESVSFELEKVPSRLPSRPWGWVSLGLGLASVGAAVGFAAIRDQPYELGDACKGDNVDAEGNCRRLWNTEYHVLGFALAGAALTTLGVAILLQSAKRNKRDKKPREKKKASARFGVGPGNVTVRGWF